MSVNLILLMRLTAILGNVKESDGLSQVGRFIDVSLQQDGWNSGTTNSFLNLFTSRDESLIFM